MINLYKLAEKVILRNPFSTSYKNGPYTALFYHTMTLNYYDHGGLNFWGISEGDIFMTYCDLEILA